MSYFYKILLLTGLLSVCGWQIQAQRGSISGQLLDKESKEALAFAHVRLSASNNPSVNVISISDDNGRFLFSKLTPGSYQLEISEINHLPVQLHALHISNEQPHLDLGIISVQTSVVQLAEIQITSDIGISEISPGKTIFRVSDLPVAQGGSAGDILKLMPSVGMGGPPGVPRDVRYRGLEKAYTMVLIDGKNTGLQGNSRETIINQIPASAVERIEIISSPGAQYDGDGVSGIVNIILKKDRKYGIHGHAGVFTDNRMGYNLSAGLSHKTRRVDMYVNYDRNQANFKDNFQILETEETQLFKNAKLDGLRNVSASEWRDLPSQNLRLGSRFYINEGNTLAIEYLNGFQNEHRIKLTDTRNLNAAGLFKDRTVRTEDRHELLGFEQVKADWTSKFRKGGLLSLSGIYVNTNLPKFRTQSDQRMSESGEALNNTPALQRVNEEARDKNLFAQADFRQPFSRLYTFSAGYKYSGRERTATQLTERYDYNRQSYLPTANGNDNFRYSEAIHALYVSNEITWRKLRADAGLRYEAVQYISASLLQNTEAKGSYGLPLPVLNAYYNIDSTQFVKLSIGRRVRRPDMKQLNPFVDDADPAKIKAGNPDLLPEDAWAYELGYLKNFNFFNLGFNLFRRDLNNVIQKRISDVSQGVVLERHENVGNAYVQGLEIMTAIQPVSWFNTNLNYSRFGSKLLNEQSGGGALQDQFAWSFKAINDFHIAHWGIFAQIAYNAIGPKKAIQQSENAIQYWDAAISKRMLRDKANISLRVVDVFATNRKIRKERTEAQIRDRIQEAPGQMLSLGFNYQF